MKKRRKETKMNKTTLKDIKNLIHDSKNIHGQTNLTIESPNTERSLSNENYESHNPFTFFTNTKEKALEPQESEVQNITTPQHSSSTNTSPNFDNNTDKICIKKRELLYHPVKKRKSSITQEKEILLKKFEGKFTIKELSDKLNLPVSSLYYWAKKNHYQTKNGDSNTSISNELDKKILTQLNTMSIADLAKEYHLPYHVLYYWIKKQELSTKKSSAFPLPIQQELREKCRTSSLKILAKEYRLSEQTMRSRLKNIGCFSDGQNGFLIVDEITAEEIKFFYDENGINKTAEKFHTTKIAIKSFLK